MGIVHAKMDPWFPVDLKEEPDEVVVDEAALSNSKHSLNSVKARVDRINVDGLKRTKDDIVKGTVDELFMAKDFEDVIVRAQKVRQALDNMGCFRNVCVYIDVSSGPEATPDGLEVTFQVREMSRLVGGMNASVGEDEGNVVIDFKVPNIWGRGELAQAVYSLGYKNTCSFNISGTKPLLLRSLDPVISASMYQQNQDYPWSGYRLLDRGFNFNLDFKTSPTIEPLDRVVASSGHVSKELEYSSLDYSRQTLPDTKLLKDGYMKHNLQWEALIRDMSVIDKTSFAVRWCCGPHLKSTFRHTSCVDNRDADVFPSRGVWLQISNEVAGIGGGVANFKSEVQCQANQMVSEELGVVLQASGALGVLHDVYGTTLSEHFFLGGPTSLRGFQQRGVGPQIDGHAVGGKVFWSSALHLYSPLPFPGSQQSVFKLIKTHFFINAGCLAYPECPDCKRSSLSSLFEPRVACGAGICVKIGRKARLEINYVVLLRTQARDVSVSGLQFGVGTNFL